MSSILTISRLGAQGDGIAETPRGQVFVPFALPGERVNVSLGEKKADLVAVLDPSPLRVAPPCRHFGDCGGCAMQHLEEAAYREWKREKLVEVLASKGIDVAVDEMVSCAPYSRRRAAFTARTTEKGILLGFNAALSHRIVDLEECHVVLPSIMERLQTLRELAALIARTPKPFRLGVTQTASGLDVAAEDSGKLEGRARQVVVDFVMRSGIARLSIDGEIVVEPKKPVVMVDDVAVQPPPGAFLQAVEGAEKAMADLVGGHLRKAKRVADLFAGVGTFALRLARESEVHAVEGDAAALASLDRAYRFGAGMKKVTVEKRDLFVRPLTFKEMDLTYDGLVFDPPRAGAEDQSKQIARSQLRYVAAVSCNPVTLARDLRILIDGGYQLKRVVPLDQFIWSPHLEAVALLEKPKKRR
ncbi:class I SAM-dependent RNA methyltransferase [Mesorhizobium microcysteis]|uniref:Class I SAM-dependent RNA methyltransferase n=1 Tax=Neoaquamicrobium microcysteis TaxID=2682781 RepID=A0A5D4GSY2_9HYPH|nr:class I SAM-dependent RNA methyltransferase [Mesorhizobium microcysteis]TYR31886.1 class I SAM-dependent RNA methyltransferase [Mesorhizobium microcysteis]